MNSASLWERDLAACNMKFVTAERSPPLPKAAAQMLPLTRYGFAVVISVLTLVGLWHWPELSRDHPPIIVLVLPVLLSAYFGGLGPGLVATFLCGLGADYLLISSIHRFGFARSADAVEWLALIVIGAVVSTLGGDRRINQGDNEPVWKGTVSTERKVQAGFIVALVSLGIVGVALFVSATRVGEEADLTAHTEEVIATLRLLLSTATDAETAQRGYIITGDETYLEPHADARRRIDTEIDHLRKLCADDVSQSKRTDDLASALIERIARTDSNIDLRRNQGFAAAQASIATKRGKLLHDRLRAMIGQMISVEEENLTQRQQATAEATTLTRAIVVVGAAFAFGVVVVALFTIQHDFAGRRRAESSLREANLSLEARVRERTAALERVSGIVRSSSDAIIGKALDGTITSWNSGAEKVFGYSAEEAIGQPMLMLFPPERVDEERNILARVAHDETVPHYETERIRKDGARIAVSVTISPVQDSEGRIVGASKIARDITAQKRLDAERAQLAALIEHSREFIAIADLEGRVTFMNPSARAMIGLRDGERLSPLHFTDFMTPSWRDEFLHRIIPMVRAQGEWQGEMQLRHMETGATIDILRSTFMLRDAAGRDTAFATVTRDVTEERRAMRALRESEERLHAVTENLSEGLIVSGLDGQLLHWNRAGLELHGFQSLEEGLRKFTEFADLFELRTLDDDVLELDQWPLARILRGEQLRNVETRVRYRGGVWEKVFSYSGRIIHDASGKPLAFLAMQDITERSRAVAALQERENQLRIYAEHSPVAVAMLDREMNYLVVSRRWMEDFRLGQESVVGRSHYEIFPEVPQRWIDIHRRCLAGAVEKSEEDAFQREDGTTEWLRWEVRPWHQADGLIGGVIIFSEVVTARKQAEEAVRASEARYRALFEYAPDGIVIADPTGIYIDANASICRMLGYQQSEIIGTPASSIVAPSEAQYVEPVLAKIRQNADHQREWSFRRKDGSILTAEVIGTMMPDGNVLGMIRDITERKQAELSLRTSEKEKRSAFEANRLKSEFLANMSHELRTPLNCIIGFTEFLVDEKPGPLNAKQKEYLTDVYDSSKHLLQLINDVLDLAKVEAGKIELRPESFSLAKSIGEVCAVVKGIAQNKRVTIRSHVAADLGRVVLDQQKFKQICYNLLANAVKFTDAGGTVEITAAPVEGKAFAVSVKDTGIGIRQEDLKRLFREFEQLEVGTERRFEGTGLGLALTKKLVEFQGGRIGVESEYGHGSTFRVELPTNDGEEPQS